MSEISSIYNFTLTDIDGKEINLQSYEGQILLFVNTASKGNNKNELISLQKLHNSYKNEGFSIFAFPCRQFLRQESKRIEKIKKIYFEKMGIDFNLMPLTKVNGSNEAPIFTWLKQRDFGLLGQEIDWNYTKFLVFPDGQTVKRFSSSASYHNLSKNIEQAIHMKNTAQKQEVP